MESSSSTLSAQRARAYAVPDGSLAARFDEVGRSCRHRGRLRERRQPLLSSAAVRSRVLGHSPGVPATCGAQRQGTSGPRADRADGRTMAPAGRPDVAAAGSQNRRATAGSCQIPCDRAGQASSRDLQVPDEKSLVLGPGRPGSRLLRDLHVGARSPSGSQLRGRGLHQRGARRSGAPQGRGAPAQRRLGVSLRATELRARRPSPRRRHAQAGAPRGRPNHSPLSRRNTRGVPPRDSRSHLHNAYLETL